MRTQFSTEEFGHAAKMARRSHTRSEVDGDPTWLSRLSALYHELIAAERPEDVSARALDLAEACMDLEKQAMNDPGSLAPMPVILEPAMPTNTIAFVGEKDAVVAESIAPFIDAQDGSTFEADTDEGEEDDSETDVPPDYDGPTCPHGRPEHEAILGKCVQCRRAESAYDNAYDEDEIGSDDLGHYGD